MGQKNIITKNNRPDIFKTSSKSVYKLFIYNHIKPKNTVINDGWRSYGFLNNNNDHIHEKYIDGQNDNCVFGSHSTSHVEGIWGTLK